MKIVINLSVLTSLLAIVTTTVAETRERESSNLRGGDKLLDDSEDQQLRRKLAGKSTFKVNKSSESGSKIAWRIFEKDSDPELQDQYEHTVKFVHVNSYSSGRTDVRLYDGVEYCLRVYKGGTSKFGSATGSNEIKVQTGYYYWATTHVSISVTTPGQYFKCFKTPGSSCPYPYKSRGEKVAIASAVGPFYGYKAKQVKDEAYEVSRATGLPGEYDGEQDAFRHCYFSCRLTQEIGSSPTEKVGDIHENCFFHGVAARTKDQYNNMKGREFGEVADTDCSSRCLDAVESETLKIYE